MTIYGIKLPNTIYDMGMLIYANEHDYRWNQGVSYHIWNDMLIYANEIIINLQLRLPLPYMVGIW